MNCCNPNRQLSLLILALVAVAHLGSLTIKAASDAGESGVATQYAPVRLSDLTTAEDWSLSAELIEPFRDPNEGGTGGSGFSSPPLSASFAGLLDDGSRFVPNSQGAAGPNHLMLALSSQIRILDRAGTPLSTVSLDSFWAPIGAYEAVDPRLVYDPYGQRFIFVCASAYNPTNPNPGLLIAASRTSDPTGLWNRYFVDLDSARAVFGRSPKVGFNKNWIVVQMNMFNQSDSVFNAADIFAFNKTNVYTGGAGTFTRFIKSELGDLQNSPVPAATYDPTSSTLYFLANWNADFEGFGFLRVYSISGAINSPVFNEGETVGLQTSAPGWLDFAPNDLDFAKQLGTTNKIYLGDARLQNVVFRYGSLWTVHSIFVPTETSVFSAVQWWEVTPGGATIQRGIIEENYNETSFGYPSIAVNTNNDVVIAYSKFAPFTYPSAAFKFRVDADTFGTLREETSIKAGEASYYSPLGGINPWGEWSSTTVDPINDTEFWTVQEYASTPIGGGDRWGTWWARISPPHDLSVTATDSPDPVTAGNNVTYTINVVHQREGRVVPGSRIVSTLPAGATFVSAVASPGACVHTNGVVTCLFGTLPSEGTASATIIITPTASGLNTNRIEVMANGPDLGPTNNVVQVVTTVNASADLAISQSAFPSPVPVGSNLTFSVVVTNRGPSSATGVVLVNNLPPNGTYVSAIPTQGTCSRSGNTVTCNLGSLSSRSSVGIAIVVTGASGTLTNRSSVSATSTDGNTGNNSSTNTVRVNVSPTLQALSDVAIDEDTTLGPLSFTVGDAETPVASLSVVATSSNEALVPNGNITVAGTGSTRTLTLTPVPNQFGTTTITRRVTDTDGATTPASFVLTVRPINDRPTISDIGNQVIDEDTSTAPLSFQVGDIETLDGGLLVTVTSSNPGLIPNGLAPTGSGASRTLTVTPVAEQSGSATLTVTVNDGSLTATDTFTVTVNPVNDLPTISALSDRTTVEDLPTPAINFNIGDIETPLANLTLSAVSSDPALVPPSGFSFSGSGVARTLVIRPATNLAGTATITVRVVDQQPSTNSSSFVFTVAPVNDGPTLNALGDLTIDEDIGPQTVSLTGITSGAANESDVLTVTATSSMPALIPDPGVSYVSPANTGTLTFMSLTNASGTATITVRVEDGRATNNFVVRTFNVTIRAGNDPPLISPLSDMELNEDLASQPVPFTLTDGDTPLNNLILSVVSSNPALVPTQNVFFAGFGGNRTLQVRPQAEMFGQSTLTVTVSDGTQSSSRPFLVTVRPVNDDPGVVLLGNNQVTADEDTVLREIELYAYDLETPEAALRFTYTSSNPVLVPTNNISTFGSGLERRLVVQPATNQTGFTLINITLTDEEGASSTTSLLVTFGEVNDPPQLDPIADRTISEDSPLQSVSLTGISSGAPNENQPLQIIVSSENPGLIPTPTLSYASPDATGTLTFAPVANESGQARLNVQISDGASSNNVTIRTFIVNVTASNDLPTISPVAHQSIDEDSALLGLPFQIGDLETPVAQLELNAFSSNEELVPPSGIEFGGSASNRTITVRPSPNQFGLTTIAIRVRDANGDVFVRSFDLTVTPINDPPSISALPNLQLNEEQVSVRADFTIGDIETAAGMLLVSTSVSNSTFLPPGSVRLEGTGSLQSVIVSPVIGQLSEGEVTITVDDRQGGTRQSRFLVARRAGPVLRITARGASNELSWSTNYPNFVPQWSDSMSAPWTGLVGREQVGSQFRLFTPVVGPIRFYRLIDLPMMTVESVAPVSVLEDQIVNVPITLSEVGDSAGLRLSAVAVNATLLPTNAFAFTGNGAARMLAITPAAQEFGESVVLVTLTDPLGRSASMNFTITVMPVNDAPNFVPGVPPTVNEDAGAQSLPGWAGSLTFGAPNETAQVLDFIVSNDNPSLFSTQPAISPAGVLTYLPAPNAHGVAAVSVRCHDNGGTANGGLDTSAVQTFAITVASVNDVPSFVAGQTQTLAEDAAAQTIPGWATAMTAGATDEAGQALTFVVTNNNPVLFAVAPALSANGSLTYTLSPDAFGSALVSVQLRDNGGTANGGVDLSAVQTFSINVNAVNDRPRFVSGPNSTTTEDGGAQTVAAWATGISAGALNESAQTLQFGVSNNNNSLFAVQPALSSNGTLTYTTAANAHGTALVTVTLQDNGGTANGGQDASSSQTFNIVVAPVNDPPVLGALVNLEVNEDSSDQTVVLSGIGAGAPNETQTLVVTASSSAPSIVPAPGVSYQSPNGTGTLTLRPASNANGSATITVNVDDGGGSNNIVQRMFNVVVVSINDVPTITALTDVTLDEDQLSLPLPFVIGDVETPLQDLVLLSSSSNPALISTDGVTFTGAPGANRGVVIRPQTNQTGSAMVTLRVRDADNATNSVSFNVTVNAVNDAPSITGLTNRTVNEDAAIPLLPFNVADVDSPISSVSLQVRSSNEALVPNASVTLGGVGAERTLAITPVAGAAGNSTITVTAADGSATNIVSFILTVMPVDDPPTIALIADQQMSEDGMLPVSIVVADEDTPLNALAVTATSGSPGIVANSGLTVTPSGATRTLTIVPVPDQFGTVSITATVHDGLTPVSRVFTLNINPLNDPPTLGATSDLTIPENSALQTITLTGLASGPVNESQPLTITASSSNPQLIPHPVVSYTSPSTTGTLRFTPAADLSGGAVITVTLDDGQASNNRLTRTIVVTVLAMEDPASISNIPNTSTAEDTPVTIPFSIADSDTDAFRLLLSATSSNTNLVSGANISFEGSGTNRWITLIPSPDQSGTTTIDVTVSDGPTTASDSFVLTVAPVNDRPTMDLLPDIALVASSPSDQSVNLSGITRGPADENVGNLVLAATSSNVSLVTIRARSYTSPGTTGIQRIRPGVSAGQAPVTISVNDSQPTNNLLDRTFMVYVRLANNTPPTIGAVANQSISEDASTGPIAFTVGDAETPVASLTLNGQSSNPALIPPANIAFSGTGINRMVTVTPLPNQTGSALITIVVVDGGSGMSSVSFTVTVNAQNDNPTISSFTPQSITENGSSGILNFTVTDPETPAGRLNVTASSSNPTLIPISGFILGGTGTNRALRVIPATAQSGSATVTVQVTDANGGTASTVFNVMVGMGTIPELRIRLLNPTTARISWPSASTGYTLQSRATFESVPGWANVPGTPVVVGNEFTVDILTTDPARFYQLRR